MVADSILISDQFTRDLGLESYDYSALQHSDLSPKFET